MALSLLKNNPKIIVFLVLGLFLFLILGILLLIFLLPALGSLLKAGSQIGIKGIIDSIWQGSEILKNK